VLAVLASKYRLPPPILDRPPAISNQNRRFGEPRKIAARI
jgi:hypothetical protein